MRFPFFPGGSYIGGLETVTLALMRELKAQGHPCFAIVSGWNDGQYPAKLVEANVPYQSIKLGRLYLSRPRWTLDGLIHLPSARRQLRDVIANFRPDVMVLTSVEFALTVTHIAPRTVPCILHLHDLPNNHWSTWLGRRVLRRAIGVVAISEFVRILALDVVGSRLPVRTVRNGLPECELLVRSPFPKLRVGIVGQLLERKRHGVLIDAVGLLEPNLRKRFEVRIYGSDSSIYADEMKKRIQQAGLTDYFRWMGFVSSQAEIYRNIDVLVAPAVEEPYGMTVLEAGSCGLPVVATRSGGHTEMVEDGVTGLLVPPDDPKALAQALEWLLDENLRASLGEQARRHISSNFTVKAMAEKFVAAVEAFGVRGAS